LLDATATRVGLLVAASKWNTSDVHVGSSTSMTATSAAGVHATTDGMPITPGGSKSMDTVGSYYAVALAAAHVYVEVVTP
jgi:hypothetical protein